MCMEIDRKDKVDLFSEKLSIQRLFQLVDTITAGESKCVGCGMCCGHRGELTLTDVEYLLIKDGSPHRDDGVFCRFLTEDNQCSVYENRPIECRLYNVIDREIFVDCSPNPRETKPIKYLAIRELVYRALFFISTTIKPMKEWFPEDKRCK